MFTFRHVLKPRQGSAASTRVKESNACQYCRCGLISSTTLTHKSIQEPVFKLNAGKLLSYTGTVTGFIKKSCSAGNFFSAEVQNYRTGNGLRLQTARFSAASSGQFVRRPTIRLSK